MSTINNMYEEYREAKSRIHNLTIQMLKRYKYVGQFWLHIVEPDTYFSVIPRDLVNLIKKFMPGYICRTGYHYTIGATYMCPECTTVMASFFTPVVCPRCKSLYYIGNIWNK